MTSINERIAAALAAASDSGRPRIIHVGRREREEMGLPPGAYVTEFHCEAGVFPVQFVDEPSALYVV